MVKPEQFIFHKNKPPKGVTAHGAAMTYKQLERASNGAWFIVFEMRLVFKLEDGRTVVLADKLFRVRAEQQGKKPNPKAFGQKQKKGKK